MQIVPYRVVSRVVVGPATVTLGLVPVAQACVTAAPGQFMMVWCFGIGEIPISVSGIVNGGVIEITVRAVGATSAAIVDAGVADVLGMRGPYGTAWPMGAVVGRDVIVMAGGLGLAPLRLAIESMVSGRAGQRSLTLLIGAREPAQVLYAEQLPAWRSAGADVRVTVDVGDSAWHGPVGTATAVFERMSVRADVAFVCGPEMMMVSAAQALVRAGMSPAQVFVSMERNMHCGIGHCGRCQLGPLMLCRDGAVVPWEMVSELVQVSGR
ncbi:unannotated protein [freshwater metagenome]|uniref:Unannotated protein n=1 Tax=freshwater metagenome TaxID=449393 RepID=A0A6J7ECC2_9ZZZZ|nr:oxidoreductase [Actinomycetota bacterium]